MELSKEAISLLSDRLEVIERALGLPSYRAGLEPTISEADVMAGRLDKFVRGLLWEDCNGEAECLECSRKLLAGMEDPTNLSSRPTAIPVDLPFMCRCQTKKSVAV